MVLNTKSLAQARRVQNDEFYTRWDDIAREMEAYVRYDPDIFRGKTVLLPCDDPEHSKFVEFFVSRFSEYGLKKLMATSYSAEDLFYQSPGRAFVMTGAEGKSWYPLGGDGDFRSDEITRLRNESDIVITNPPFSLFREFMSWLLEGEVQFSVIGTINAITYRNVFPGFVDGSLRVGAYGLRHMKFAIPENSPVKHGQSIIDGVRHQELGNVCWITTFEHGQDRGLRSLLSARDNLKHNIRLRRALNGIKADCYQKYDNHEAIDVPVASAIPSDYSGVMGVPLTLFDNYNPEQFEIVGFDKGSDGRPLRLKGKEVYTRVLVRHRHPEEPLEAA